MLVEKKGFQHHLFVSFIATLGHFPNWTFFPNQNFPNRHIPHWTIPQLDISLTQHFPERLFPQLYISLGGYLPDYTFPLPGISELIKMD